jgi:hypothetical protein
MGRRRMHTGFWWGTQEEIDYCEDIRGWIILKRVVEI